MLMVPLRTGQVLFAVAWAVSEGPDRFVGNPEGDEVPTRRLRDCGVYRL